MDSYLKSTSNLLNYDNRYSSVLADRHEGFAQTKKQYCIAIKGLMTSFALVVDFVINNKLVVDTCRLMTILASQVCMCAFQRKTGELMVEKNGLPSFAVMTTTTVI